jgi:S-adenosylmethionine hydrolase
LYVGHPAFARAAGGDYLAPAAPRRERMTRRPIITLTTDFGTSDAYVAALKAAILARLPDACLVDVTHHVPRHDLLRGSITLERAVDEFWPGTFHLCVVDPGVGTGRRLLVVDANGRTVVCPDNGLITWTRHCHPDVSCFDLTWRPAKFSHTFHGRDVMAPAIAMLAAGQEIGALARPAGDVVLLDVKPARTESDPIRVIYVDSFGNATTNLNHRRLKALGLERFSCSGIDLGPLRHTYADVAPGQPLALIGSSGLLEIAVRDGSAAAMGVRVGDVVERTSEV